MRSGSGDSESGLTVAFCYHPGPGSFGASALFCAKRWAVWHMLEARS
jgi:hypothetical protein